MSHDSDANLGDNTEVTEGTEAQATEAPTDLPEADVVAEEGTAQSPAEDVEADLAEAGEAPSPQDEIDELTADLKRVSAEYANYRKRAERDRQATIQLAKAQVATTLLPMADDFDLAAQHGDLEEGGALKAFSDKFLKVITDMGVEKFGEPGDEFDPSRHEAVQDASTGDTKVLGTVLRPGYTMGDRVLRTAMVIISDPE